MWTLCSANVVHVLYHQNTFNVISITIFHSPPPAITSLHKTRVKKIAGLVIYHGEYNLIGLPALWPDWTITWSLTPPGHPSCSNILLALRNKVGLLGVYAFALKAQQKQNKVCIIVKCSESGYKVLLKNYIMTLLILLVEGKNKE